MSTSNPAETYESYMVPALFAPWAERLVELAGPSRGERVLDLGCGTGIVARRIAARGAAASVTGLDLSPHMLQVARAAAQREGLAVRWEQGQAERLPFADGSFELVVSQFALMFFADQRAALGEVHRVLAGDGRLALGVWQGLERHPFYQALHQAIAKRAGMSGVQDIFALGDSVRLRALLEEAGFRQVAIDPVSMTARFPDPENFLAGEIDVDTASIPAMQHLDAGERERIVQGIRSDMSEPLREHIRDGHVAIPFHALLLRARK